MRNKGASHPVKPSGIREHCHCCIYQTFNKPFADSCRRSGGHDKCPKRYKQDSSSSSTPVPVYVSSVVENTAPSVIEISYNLALANIVPAVSAFTVQVNSTMRSISTVSVSGTKVLLSLAIPVAYGNTVTVAYTKPSTNPLQTAAGGQAATISAQSVINRISQPVSPPAVVTPPPTTPNSPPVPVVNFPEETYSGFIGDISAKGSYDADKDKLSFSWKTPDNIPVSSNTGEAIQFLAPVIDTKQTYEFALTVSDGKTTQTKTFPITIIPYEPYLEATEVISVKRVGFPFYKPSLQRGRRQYHYHVVVKGVKNKALSSN
ncbi:MAG: hypothetical protein IPI69_14830 [Bacteroidales bacterium]|nr:hypothetical protein [Bacteroidales bacterium]